MEQLQALKTEKDFEHSIEKWIEVTESHIKKQLEVTNEVVPTFYLLMIMDDMPQIAVVPVGHMFDSHIGKDIAAEMIRRLCMQHQVAALMFASEAWVVKRDTTHMSREEIQQDLKKMTEDGLQDNPERVEAVIITKELKSGASMEVYELKTEPGNNRLLGDQLDGFGDGIAEAKGRFVNLLYTPKFEN